MITREQLLAEEKNVTTPIKITHWYVTHEQAVRQMTEELVNGEDPDRITSPEGWHIHLMATENGRIFSKHAHITPSSCAARVMSPENLWREAAHLAGRREKELRRDIAWHRLASA